MAIDLKGIYTRLGLTASRYDLGWVNNANNHTKINKWSLNKPIQYNGSDWYKPLTAEQKKQLMYGYTCADKLVLTYDTLQKYYSGVSPLPAAWVVEIGKEHLSLGFGWKYTPNTSRHRLTDWQGYDHTINYLFRCTTIKEDITQGEAINLTIDMQLSLGDFASRFNNMYLGIMMWMPASPTLNRYLKTTTTQIKDLGTVAQIRLTETDTRWMTAGGWRTALFASKSIASTFVGDKSQSYYVTKWTTGNCEAIPFIDRVGIRIVE